MIDYDGRELREILLDYDIETRQASNRYSIVYDLNRGLLIGYRDDYVDIVGNRFNNIADTITRIKSHSIIPAFVIINQVCKIIDTNMIEMPFVGKGIRANHISITERGDYDSNITYAANTIDEKTVRVIRYEKSKSLSGKKINHALTKFVDIDVNNRIDLSDCENKNELWEFLKNKR